MRDDALNITSSQFETDPDYKDMQIWDLKYLSTSDEEDEDLSSSEEEDEDSEEDQEKKDPGELSRNDKLTA